MCRVVLLFTPLLTILPARAAEDVQVINLGPHTFYVPKSWMQSYGTFTAFAHPRTMVDRPQSTPIDASDLAIRPSAAAGNWGAFDRRDLPDLIGMIYASGAHRDPMLEVHRRWLDDAASQKGDESGFVRVATGFIKPGEPLQWERYVYKGYQSAYGEPLMVVSSNLSLIPSTVNISLYPDISIEYRFSNKKFPRSTWWNLYQRVVAFLDFLQTPK
jgi:hypothetical protein